MGLAPVAQSLGLVLMVPPVLWRMAEPAGSGGSALLCLTMPQHCSPSSWQGGDSFVVFSVMLSFGRCVIVLLIIFKGLFYSGGPGLDDLQGVPFDPHNSVTGAVAGSHHCH